ncbi:MULTISPECIES: hypothetical protein [unclassified Carboxylicivirga]
MKNHQLKKYSFSSTYILFGSTGQNDYFAASQHVTTYEDNIMER